MIGNVATTGPGAPDSGFLPNTRWTDMSFPLAQDKQGQNLKPDYDFTNLGLLFPQNDPSEEIYVVSQMDHRKKLNSDIHLHIHFIQNSINIPNFTIEYKWYNNGQIVPTSWITLNTDDGSGAALSYPGSGDMLQIIPFPTISFVGEEGLSSNFEFKLYRDDNLVVGDVLTKFVDYHYEIDSDGSQEEYIK